MIRNLWYAVLESKEIGKRKPVGVTRLGERLVFWRDEGGKLRCFYDRCAHRGASLALGEIREGAIRCPFHGLAYDSSGKCTLIPANGKSAAVPQAFKMRSYPCVEKNGFVFIWWGDKAPDPIEPPFFQDLDGFSHWKSAKDPWENHYTRVAENQLDVAHLAFVHRTTIGKGNRTLVEGPGIEWKNDMLFFQYVFNKVDDGSKPRSPKEVPVPDPNRDYRIEFLMPNLWENRISDKMRVVAAFVPVDETNTILYLRYYQNIVKLPILRHLMNAMGMAFSIIVAHQDRRIVNTQVPKGDGTGKGESLFPGDYPIMEFRKRRLELGKRA